MSPLAERLHAFGAALLDPGRPVPPGLVGPEGAPSALRFGVYRNNVMVGLVEALRANFPAVARLVGEPFFTVMARDFARAAPPAAPMMHDYGADFPAFVATFGPASGIGYLADVARIERAVTEAYHAAEADALDPAALAAIPPHRAGELRPRVHPSLRVVRSRHPALTIWRMNTGDGRPGPVDLGAGGEDALVVRPAAGVELRAMPPGGFEFVDALAMGSSLATAAAAALRADARFDLAGNLGELIAIGAFARLDMADDDDA